MNQKTTRKTVVTALFAALICIATMLVQIPIPATGGYGNLGDGVILIAAFLFQPLYAVIAAGVGSALADILSGYVAFAPGTLIIKAGVALIAALLFRHQGKHALSGKKPFRMGVACVAAEIFMVAGYFFYEAVLMGAGLGAAGGIIGNIGQGIVGSLIACAVTPALYRIDALQKFNDIFSIMSINLVDYNGL